MTAICLSISRIHTGIALQLGWIMQVNEMIQSKIDEAEHRRIELDESRHRLEIDFGSTMRLKL